MLRTQKVANCRTAVTSNVSAMCAAREMKKEMKILYGLTLSVEHQLKSMGDGVVQMSSDLFLLCHHEFE